MTDGYVVNNHGNRCCPLTGRCGTLSKWPKWLINSGYILTIYYGMILQVGATAHDPLLSEVFSCLVEGKKVTRKVIPSSFC